MRKLILAAMMMVMLVTTGCTVVPPGEVGVKVNLLGDSRGVSKEALVSGAAFYIPFTTRIVKYPIYANRVSFTHDTKEGNPVNEEITFNTKDSVPVNIDVAITYQLQEKAVPEFYTKFRCDKIQTFTHGFLRDSARNIITKLGSEYNFDEINGVKKEEFLAKVGKDLNAGMNTYGVTIIQFGLIGSLRPPQALLEAVNAKTQAIQKSIQVENEVRQAEAEAKKKVAIATGESAANKALASSLDPKLLEWERLQIEKIRATRWNGVMPSTMLGSGATTLLNLK